MSEEPETRLIILNTKKTFLDIESSSDNDSDSGDAQTEQIFDDLIAFGGRIDAL